MASNRISQGSSRNQRCAPLHGTHMPANPCELRRSARLSAISQPKKSIGNKWKESLTEPQPESGLPPTSDILQDRASKRPKASPVPLLKRKREQCFSFSAQHSSPSKRPRTSAQEAEKEAENKIGIPIDESVQNWILNKTWPSNYFEPDEQTKKELLEHDSWLEEMMAQPPIPVVQYKEINGFRYPMPIKKAPPSLRRKQSDSSLIGSSDQNNRDGKSTPYRNPRYTTILETKGSFLRDVDYKIPQGIKDTCHQLLAGDQIVPQNTLFCDDHFDRLCWKLQDRNEAMVVQDITRLLVPSAMNLAIYGDSHLDILIESVNEAWSGSIPVEGPKPQPDYAVGFDRSAFTDEQLEKLGPLVGTVFDTSFFMATFRMYFPFLTCEVKCGASALDIADRQNAHNMTVAIRGIVELYRAVKRETELDRQILAFSISHDHRAVRIYGHYPVINGKTTTYYRHPIHTFDFTAMDGRERWTTYKFTKSVYDVWMPTHLQRICSAIEELPSLDFGVAEWPGDQSETATGLSQDIGSLLSGPSDNTSRTGQENDVLIPILQQTETPHTSAFKAGGQGAAKRAKKNSAQK